MFPALLSCILLCGCFTGIESTKKIQLTKEEQRALETAPEMTFMNQVEAQPLGKWSQGKRFVPSATRAYYLFDRNSLLDAGIDTAGFSKRILEYAGYGTESNPDGSSRVVLKFLNNGKTILYPCNAGAETAAEKIVSDDVPMLIDLDMVDTANRLLKGKTLWTRSPLWYDADDHRHEGVKFIPVTIDSVTTGNFVFPLKVAATTTDGQHIFFYMNFGYAPSESRSFNNLFYLSDIKDKYPGINRQTWKLIQEGKLKAGMTKEECRLSIGNPSDTDSGHNWSQTLDIWKYPNGKFLRFADGVLVDYRL